jgi:RHS repeat-associated protein
VNYTYSSAGRALSAIDPTGPINYVTSATYTPHGALATGINGFVSGGFAGITTTNIYNSRLQPCRLSSRTTGSAPSQCTDNANIGNIMDRKYDFHAGTGDNGNVFQIINNRDSNRTQNFTYDALNRIQTAYTNGPNWGEDFTIDAWANLTNRALHPGKTTYESLNAPALPNNRLSGFGYDAAGNLTANGTTGYNYDAENRMTKFVGDTTDIYVYDGDGARVKKNAASVTLYWYGAGGDVLDETSSTGALTSEYIFFNGKRVARRDADNSVKYYFSDHLGSASVVTDNLGVVKEESDYYPYGGEIAITNNDPNHYKFTGKERDAESGLDMFGARYYASSLARFMIPDWSEDPYPVPYANFQNPQTLNLYAHLQNNPLSRIDADGHVTCDPDTVTWRPTGVTVSAGACHLDFWDRARIQAAFMIEMQQQAAKKAIQGVGSVLGGLVKDCGCDENSDPTKDKPKESSSSDDKPKRVSNPKHHPNSESPEPKNVQELFDKSIADGSGVRWAKDSDGTIHRFSAPSNGESHWNGSTGGSKPIRQEDIPIEIRRALK